MLKNIKGIMSVVREGTEDLNRDVKTIKRKKMKILELKKNV